MSAPAIPAFDPEGPDAEILEAFEKVRAHRSWFYDNYDRMSDGPELTVLLALALPVPAFAQSIGAVAPPTPPSQVAVIQPSATDNIPRAGTEIPLITREELTTKKKQLRVGQRVQMEVSVNVTQSGVTVIPAGTPAVGEITEVRNKGMWGKSGYIGARVLSLRLGDRHVRLTGTFDDKGVTGTGGVVAAVAFVPIAGFFTTGTSAFIASGSATKGFLDEDIAFRTVATPAPILDIPAAGQPLTPQPSPGGLVPVSMTPAAGSGDHGY